MSATAAADAGAPPVRRLAEIEDPSNLLVVHPISNRLVAPFARAGIPPNAVSVAGMGCGLAAGLCYAFPGSRPAVLAGFALMVGWHVMDGVDGQLARLTNTHSPFGKVLDGVCDYVTFGAVYAGLGSALARSGGASVWALVAASAVAHAVQSAVYEQQRHDYEFLAHGRGAPPASPTPIAGGAHRRAADRLLRVYTVVQRLGSGGERSRRLAALLPARPALRAAYRAEMAPMLRRWSVLSANWRTVAIFVAALLGHPAAFFVWEIGGLSALALALRAGSRRRLDRVLSSPAAPG